MRVLLFGIQGSGKSTIGKYIAEKFEVPFISVGDIFRELREDDSETGRLVKSLIDQGKFVPDELTMRLINERLDEEDCKNGFVLDGAPRNLAQESLFRHEVDLVIMVDLDERTAIDRLRNRARHDDSEEAIKNRIDWHKENTVPLIDFFRSKGVRCVDVDNSPTEEEVRKSIDELFKN
jgi:adenylate kinase